VTLVKDRTLLVCILVLFIGSSLLYRSTLTYNYSGDDLQYSMLIELFTKNTLFYHPAGAREYIPQAEVQTPFYEANSAMVNPRYLLEWPTSILAGKVWRAAGWDGSVIVPIQAIRILVGALGLVFFFLAMNELLNDKRIAILCSVGLGIGGAYWSYSIHMDQSINMVLFLSLAFWVLARQYKRGFTLRGKIILAALLAMASFYNFTAALSTLAFAFGVAFLHPEASIVAKIKQFILFCAIYGVIVVVGIAIAVSVFVSPASLIDANFWRGVLFGGKPEYNVNIINDTLRAGIGLAKSQTLYPGVAGAFQDYFDTASTTSRVLLLGFFAVILVILLLPFAYLASKRKNLSGLGKIVVILVVWFAAHSLFNWFWDPGFNKYWLMPLLCCWALAGIALYHIKTSGSRYYALAQNAALAFVAVTFIINLTTQFLPESREDFHPWIADAKILAEESQPNDLFISSGHPLDFHIAYYGHRDVVATGLIEYDKGGSTEGIVEAVSKRIDDHLADQGKIYVYGFNLLPADAQVDIQEWIKGFELKPAWEFPDMIIYEVVPS
jgi:hypothetical protein